MRLRTRWIGAGLLAINVLLGLGCVAANYPGMPSALELSQDITPVENPRLARMQRGEDAPRLVAQASPPAQTLPVSQARPASQAPQGTPAPPAPIASPSVPLRADLIPPAPPSPSSAIPPPPGVGGGGGAQQVSLKSARNVRTAVRAWVNGRPIFDEEVLLSIEMSMPQIFMEPDREKVAEAVSKTLNNIVDMEIAYQDAVKKLEKANPRALDKLKDYVDQEFERNAREIRKKNEAKFQEVAHTYRRVLERQFIGMEYIRSRIGGPIGSIGNQEIEDYYRAHLNEFQKVATVKWQHVFVGLNAQRPTVAAARAFAESLLEKVRLGGDFADLARYDDGDSKARNGLGFGTRQGEIKPAELEQYLFKMSPGQAGLLEFSTGVHLFRLVEREDSGQIPLTESVQNQIRTKLRNQIFDRELKRFIRELKTRAVVEIEKET